MRQKRKAAFVDCAADYQIRDGEDFKVTINAKDFPLRGVFKVYRVFGDITKPKRLHQAINNLLSERGVGNRRIVVSI